MRPRKEQQQRQEQAAIYIRVSTDKQVRSGLGLDDQLDKTLNEAKHLGYAISDDFIFVDKGISGKKNGDKRLEYARMMNLVADGVITCIIVNDLSRLGRSVRLISNALFDMDKHDCALISVKEHLDTSSAMGKAMLNMIATFAQLESDLASERTEDALSVRGDKYGYKSGQLPYGYERTSNTSDVRSDEVIRICEHEAFIVREIFKLHSEGYSMNAIADIIGARFNSPRNGKKWYAKTISLILDKKSVYNGEVTHYPAIL